MGGGNEYSVRSDCRKMTVPAQHEFILCNSLCSRFLPEKRLHSTGGDGHERKQQHKQNTHGLLQRSGRKQGAVIESNGL